MIEKLKVLAGAVPAWGAAVQAVLVAFAVKVVPLLPVALGVKVAAAIGAVAASVRVLVAVVSSVTPVPDQAQGLVLPPNRELTVDFSYLGGEKIEGRRIRR